jgi:hypothetical protein
MIIAGLFYVSSLLMHLEESYFTGVIYFNIYVEDSGFDFSAVSWYSG